MCTFCRAWCPLQKVHIMALNLVSFSWSFFSSKEIFCDFYHFQCGFGLLAPIKLRGLDLGEACSVHFLISSESSIRSPPYGLFLWNVSWGRFRSNFWFHPKNTKNETLEGSPFITFSPISSWNAIRWGSGRGLWVVQKVYIAVFSQMNSTP